LEPEPIKVLLRVGLLGGLLILSLERNNHEVKQTQALIFGVASFPGSGNFSR